MKGNKKNSHVTLENVQPENDVNLKNNKLKISRLIEHSNEGLAILTVNGDFLYLTPWAEKFLGKSVAEIKGLSIFDFILPEDAAALFEVIKTVLAGPVIDKKDCSVRIRSTDGRYRWIEASFKNLLHDPLINGIVFNFRDINEPKLEAEKTVRLKWLHTFISRLDRAITHSSDEGTYLKKACELAVEVGQFKAAWIGRLDLITQEIKLAEQAGMGAEASFKTSEVATVFLDSQNIVVQSGNPFVCNTAAYNSQKNDYSDAAAEMGFGSFVVLPLKKEGAVIGTFNLYTSDLNFFTTEEINKLEEATENLSAALDIFDRLRNKRNKLAALQKTEANLKAIVSSTQEGFILIDTKGLIIEFNNNAEDAIYRISNKRLKEEKDFFEFFQKVRSKEYRTYFEKVLIGETVSFDHCYGILWYNFTISPVYKGEAITGICLFLKEITERKNAENTLSNTSQELKKTLSELNNVLDSSLDVICTINRDGEFIRISAASQRIWGYKPEELIGSKFINLVYGEDVPKTAEVAEKIYEGIKIPTFENRYVHKTGRLVPMLWSLNWDENLGIVYCIAKDVTEKKRFAEAIENERDQFYNMFLKAPSAIGMLKGPNHIFEMANPLYLQLTGKKSVIGKTVAEVLPEVVEQGFIDMLDFVYQTGESYTDTETLVKVDTKGNGKFTDFYINFIYQAYRNNDGVIEGVFFFINDITEQVLSKKKIEKSEKQYRQIVETAQEGIWLLDENSRTTFVNKKMCEILEYTEKEILGKENYYFMDADGKKVALIALERRRRGIAENLEYTFISKTGKNILTKVSANPIFDDEGIFRGSLGMVSDITEKKHLENLLEKSNRLARIGSWEIDVPEGTVYWSDITKEIREAEPDFVPDLKTGISFFTEGEHKKIILQRVQQCMEKGIPWDEELQFTTFKGNLKWVRTIGEAVFTNGKCTKIYGSFQDITERKNAVEKVLRSEEKLNVAQRIAEVGSWEVNLLNDEHSWSNEFYRILGINKDVLPSSEAFYPFVHPEDRAMAVSIMNAALANKEDSSFSFRFLRENGEVGFALSQWRFEFDSIGNPLFIYGILRDLTKEKMAERERLKMISDIVQRNKDLEQFSYIISHNLRSPVANIIGLTEELKDETHSAEIKLMLGEALSSDANRLENVIADLNTILQTKTEITERKEQVVLTELARNIELSISDLIQKEKVTITTDFSAVDNFKTIKSYMQSIFYNLISNSIKYRQPTVNPVISIRSRIDNSKLFLIFKDNGMGIDLVKEGDQIFGLYKRFHSDTEGKGMGLYMVKTQVETLGGKISVNSELNKGAVFTIEFDYSN